MEKDLRDLLERAERTFGGRPIEATVPRARAIVGPERFAIDLSGNADLVSAADTALDILRGRRSGTPTVAQFKALQIMIRLARPAIYSRDGALEPYPRTPGSDDAAGGERQQRWEVFRGKAQPLLYSVGRIDLGDRPFGTGFVIAPGLVLTNRHVLEALSFDTYRLEPGQATIDFGAEDGTVGHELPVPIEGVVGWHEELDLALLRTPVEGHRTPFVFGTPPVDGDWVVALGYPMRDPSNSPEMMDQLFEGRYEIKRAAPGEVVGTRPDRVFHDCSTLGGNSGSPLVSLETAEVVGVHSNGFFTWRNEGVVGPAAQAFVAAHAEGQQQIAGGLGP